MEYKFVYVLYERHTRNGEIWFKSARKRPDVYIADEWHKCNEVRWRRFNELEKCALDTGNFKSKDFCDEIYSLKYKDGLLIELVIEKRALN